MFKAHLSDPIHGESVQTAETALQAVESAYRELAARWCDPADVALWPADGFFDGEIRGVEVWFHNRAWCLLGTVVELPSDIVSA